MCSSLFIPRRASDKSAWGCGLDGDVAKPEPPALSPCSRMLSGAVKFWTLRQYFGAVEAQKQEAKSHSLAWEPRAWADPRAACPMHHSPDSGVIFFSVGIQKAGHSACKSATNLSAAAERWPHTVLIRRTRSKRLCTTRGEGEGWQVFAWHRQEQGGCRARSCRPVWRDLSHDGLSRIQRHGPEQLFCESN